MSTRKIYRKLAKKYKTTAEEIKREMQNAIYYAYQDPFKDTSKKAIQAEIPSKGEIPTVEEVLQFAVTRVREKK